jgi:alkanesulfonate monooxygenase SsuD/methylene tetrahydromethanopterin reductase-like flavin-dependent oxidoreductase (luciferase family)
VAEIRQVAEHRLAGYWVPMLNGHDTLTALAVAGQETDGVELWTAVMPMPLRPPFALAQQIATVQEAIGGRLVIGLSPSHEALVTGLFGLDWSPPLAATRRYLTELTRIMSGAWQQRVVVANRPLLCSSARSILPRPRPSRRRRGDVGGRAAEGRRGDPACCRETGQRRARIVTALPTCVTNDAAPAGRIFTAGWAPTTACPPIRRYCAVRV